MKKLMVVMLAVILLLVSVSCNAEEKTASLPPAGGVSASWAIHFDNLADLCSSADVIAVGVIDRLVEVVPPENERDILYYSKWAFRVEKTLKGEETGEMVLYKMGAPGKPGEITEDPLFQVGERWVLFLRKSPASGVYNNLGPWGRYKVVDGNVRSMNYVLRNGQYRAPQELNFWKIDLDTFIVRVTETLDRVRLTFTDDKGLQADVRRLPAGFFLNININLATGRNGQGEVRYTVNLVDCQDGKDTLPLPDEMALDIKPDTFTVEPGNTYTSNLGIGVTPRLQPGSYCIAVEYIIGESIEGRRVLTLHVEPPEEDGIRPR